MKPMVALVGLPNVGKSTLFNRILGRRLALVEDRPGVTRDRHYADSDWQGHDFTLIDTGGFKPDDRDSLLVQVREQVQVAIEECTVVIWVMDGRMGASAIDQTISTMLRKSSKTVVVAINKIDSERQVTDGDLAEFHRLGWNQMFPISAEHAHGIGDLLDQVIAGLPPTPEAIPEDETAEKPVRVAIIGRPNVGKSTLVNSLLHQRRVIASEIPGTTRDPIDSHLTFENRPYILTDTAGIRRKSAVSQNVERFAVIGALKVIEDSDVAVLLLDATEPAVDQDAKLAGLADEKGKALIIAVNKWDLIAKTPAAEKKFRDELKYLLKFVAYAPVVFISALHGHKVEKVLQYAAQLSDRLHGKASTPKLNRLLKQITENHPAPFAHGRALRLYYIAQVGTAPPAFAITCNRPTEIPERYKRYITNQLREAFDLHVPLRLFFRERPGQEKRKARKRLTEKGALR